MQTNYRNLIRVSTKFAMITFQPFSPDSEFGVFNIYKSRAVGSNNPNQLVSEDGFTSRELMEVVDAITIRDVSEFEIKTALFIDGCPRFKLRRAGIHDYHLAHASWDDIVSNEGFGAKFFDPFPFYALVEEGSASTASLVELDPKLQTIRDFETQTYIPRKIWMALPIPNGESWMSFRLKLMSTPLVVDITPKNSNEGSPYFEISVLPRKEQMPTLVALLEKDKDSKGTIDSRWAQALLDSGILNLGK